MSDLLEISQLIIWQICWKIFENEAASTTTGILNRTWVERYCLHHTFWLIVCVCWYLCMVYVYNMCMFLCLFVCMCVYHPSYNNQISSLFTTTNSIATILRYYLHVSYYTSVLWYLVLTIWYYSSYSYKEKAVMHIYTSALLTNVLAPFAFLVIKNKDATDL